MCGWEQGGVASFVMAQSRSGLHGADRQEDGCLLGDVKNGLLTNERFFVVILSHPFLIKL